MAARAALVADRGTPVRLDFADGGVSLSAGAEDEGRAEEQLEAELESEAVDEEVADSNAGDASSSQVSTAITAMMLSATSTSIRVKPRDDFKPNRPPALV